MSTAISMHSPDGRFGSHSHDLSPAFRHMSAAALWHRTSDLERMLELARSDEFSDDESDGEEESDDEEEEDEDDDEESDRFEDQSPRSVEDRRSEAPESETDADETVLVPFIRPMATTGKQQPSPQGSVTASPKGDDWTLVDKSPTFESLVHGQARLTETWFEKP
ncbi:hypothetical protein Poli38472_004669 [Pythium oligandrum]|uniref:Uncharacterized protein n=1 Tax=Pythium oligandrum TaxID=41045 RepID=A0A8K1CB69_PYTOL|nr:hypothetical protein Poli38472_004669 [Pythium oligandrum]|eukprot:TMW59600.1 hypothetical protein Poli38472_004669 [Pythium oligandrum]